MRRDENIFNEVSARIHVGEDSDGHCHRNLETGERMVEFIEKWNCYAALVSRIEKRTVQFIESWSFKQGPIWNEIHSSRE